MAAEEDCETARNHRTDFDHDSHSHRDRLRDLLLVLVPVLSKHGRER